MASAGDKKLVLTAYESLPLPSPHLAPSEGENSASDIQALKAGGQEKLAEKKVDVVPRVQDDAPNVLKDHIEQSAKQLKLAVAGLSNEKMMAMDPGLMLGYFLIKHN
jgi:hypothetical protein